MIASLVRRWNSWRKLQRGRCQSCGAILRDDATSRTCSPECAANWQNLNAV